jgi:hypothetical protein
LFGGKKNFGTVLNKNKNSNKNGDGNNSNKESQPLLSSTRTSHKIVMATTKEPPLYTNTPVITMVMWSYFVLKLVVECLLSSSATLTSFLLGGMPNCWEPSCPFGILLAHVPPGKNHGPRKFSH